MFYWILAIGSVFVLILLGLFISFSLRPLYIVTLVPLAALTWLLIAFHIRQMLQRHFHSLANVIESLRVGDYSLRIAAQDTDSAWGEVYHEINKLAEGYQEQRLQYVESDILIDKLLAEFEVPVFVFDRSLILRNINHMGSTLFEQPKTELIGLHAHQLHLSALLDSESGAVLEHWFPNRGGRWELRRNHFMQGGQKFTLVLVNDLSRTLREEERTAWLRLIRVLGHELNNSLASMISVSDTLIHQLDENKDEAWRQRYHKALNLIGERSKSLLRFTEAYTRLAKLPKPNKRQTELLSLVTSLADLIEGSVKIVNTESLSVQVDPDQISQLLINLMKNAVEASPEGGPIEVRWQEYNQGVRLQIIDQGVGLASSDNLFVPFYTTKANGNGIGLFLCRQIAEAHNGTLRLYNRDDGSGCIAECWLPQGLQEA